MTLTTFQKNRRMSWAAALLAGTAILAACETVSDVAEATPTAVVSEPEAMPEIAADAKPVIASSEDLPRFSYEIDSLPSELLVSDALLLEYGPKLRADIESVLAEYDISDPATESSLISSLAQLDMLEGDYESVLARVERMTELAEKPAEKFTTGLFMSTIASAKGFATPVDETMASRLDAMPFALVQEDIEGSKGTLEIYSENLILGIIQGQYDDGALERGAVSNDILSTLVSMRYVRDVVLPYKDEMIAPMAAYIEANSVEKPDIWADRDIDLTGMDGLDEVTIVAWDSGVDVPIFSDQLWTNSAETMDGADTDGNGFVDDLHGIAFDLNANQTPLLLHPVDQLTASEDEVRANIKGWLDTSANINSPEASAIKSKLGSLEADQVQPLLEDLNLYGNYAHGTHVAGIMLEGNPAAKLMTARLTFDFRMKPEPYLEEDAAKDAAMMKEAVAYFAANGARVVNMSWGGSPESIEYTLEVNNIETDPDKRRERAYAIFEVVKSGLEDAINNAPEILFIAAAGNSDGDVSFSNFYPSGILADNIIAVGAVDQAGDETGFTSYGETVVLHANGYEVVSDVPGGTEMAFSGTSMAAPNVANLAGKLLAIDSSLTVSELIAVMKDTAEATEDGRRILVHPANAVAKVTSTKG